MQRGKAKKMKIPIGSGDEGLAEMFNQMMGTGTVNMTIAYPRYKRIKTICDQLVKLFGLMAESPFMRAYAEFKTEKTQIETFCKNTQAAMDELFSVDFSDYEWNLTLVDEELRKKFMIVYENMKKSDVINTFVMMCDRLVPYKRNFENLDKLNHKFITVMPGTDWSPFPFTMLNLKYICALDNIGGSTIMFFMTVLNKSYELSRQLYEEVQSPDIDIDQFVDFIMKSIDDIQKRPELSRCREAFQKIKESVVLLKDRFGSYYRDFISTKDNTIIMQHFILDVSKNTDASAKVTTQFRKIINFYRKMAQEKITDPKIKMLFDRVNDSFKEMERGTENLVNIHGNSESDSDSIDDDPLTQCANPTAMGADDL